MSDEFPRVRDLPEEEREPFMRWLMNQTRPILPGVPVREQDGYYQWDHDRWKREGMDTQQRAATWD